MNEIKPVPMFELYSISELAALLPYSESYLVRLKTMPWEIRPRFKATAVAVLGRTEAELFGEPRD